MGRGIPDDFGLTESDGAILLERGVAIRESALRIGSGSIFGLLSEPMEVEAAGASILFVNGGHNHRSGINRNYTEWARRLAARGHRVLRMDLRGLGDSPPPTPARPALMASPLTAPDAPTDTLTAVASAVMFCTAALPSV